jgi:polyketide cyclase/dehydrase/lipid transport protein
MKRETAIIAFLAGTALSLFAAEPRQNADWKVVKQSAGVTIYSRPHAGSHLKEFKAVGEIDAATKTVHKVIDDVEAYPNFMPYTAECRVIARKHDSILTYQRVSPKIVSDRDYTLRIQKKSWPVANGLAYLNRWEPANEQGPAEKPGVFRVKVCDGSWLLEPAGEGKTRATYSVFTDSGIVGPAFLANTISTTGISKLFAAVRKQAKNPKYQSK